MHGATIKVTVVCILSFAFFDSRLMTKYYELKCV